MTDNSAAQRLPQQDYSLPQQACWQRVRSRLRETFGDAVYRSWFDGLGFDRVDNGVATMTAPTRFVREWVMSNYANELRNAWRREMDGVHAVDIIVGRSAAPAISTTVAASS